MTKQNEQKRELNMHKQQLKIIDMHEKLKEEGFISYTTVRNFVKAEDQRIKIRQEPTVGHEIEFDWGEVKLFIDGKLRSFSLVVFTLDYSNRFAYLYESETTVCVQDAHMKCIKY